MLPVATATTTTDSNTHQRITLNMHTHAHMNLCSHMHRGWSSEVLYQIYTMRCSQISPWTFCTSTRCP